MSRLRLEAEAGELDEDDLRQINEVLLQKSDTVAINPLPHIELKKISR
jgi:hypothetical protein